MDLRTLAKSLLWQQRCKPLQLVRSAAQPATSSASGVARRAGALSSTVSAGNAPVQRSGGLATGLRLNYWVPFAACLTCGHALLKHIACTSLLSARRPLPPRVPATQPRPSCTPLIDMPSDQSTRVSVMAPAQSVRASAPVKVWNNVAFESRPGEDMEDDTRATALAAQAAARSGGAGWANSEPHNARTSTPGSELRHSGAWGSSPRPRFFPGQEGVPSPIGHRTSQTGTHRLSQSGSAMPSPSSRVSAAGSEIYPLGQLFTHISGTASPTNGWTCAEEVASREGSVNSCNSRCGLGVCGREQWGVWQGLPPELPQKTLTYQLLSCPLCTKEPHTAPVPPPQQQQVAPRWQPHPGGVALPGEGGAGL